jgi:inorganic pyrophosphatase
MGCHSALRPLDFADGVHEAIDVVVGVIERQRGTDGRVESEATEARLGTVMSAPDGDPLDVFIIHEAKTYPGVVLKCRPVGVLEVEQTSDGKRERNDRIFAVPDRSPLETDLKDIRDLPSRAREEFEEFFRATNVLENKDLKFLGWRGPKHAAKTIKGAST